MTMRTIIVAVALLLAACNARSRSMPDLQNEAALTAAMKSLSPWKDGSPDRSNDGRTPPEPGSDRQLFIGWLQRYIAHENYGQHDRDYQPMAVPATIGAAIDDQREYEQQAAAQKTQEEAENRREQQAADAERERQYAADRAAQQEQQRIADAEAAATTQAEEARMAADDARANADFECRQREEQAEIRASMDKDDPAGAIARVKATIHCPSDAPAQ